MSAGGHLVSIACSLVVYFLSQAPFAGLYGLPTRSGKIKDLSKFDAQFFGVHGKQANMMDPQARMLLELTYEAIVDAGKFLSACYGQVSNITFIIILRQASIRKHFAVPKLAFTSEPVCPKWKKV